MNHSITVEIKPDGETTVGVHGVAGPSCREVTSKIEAALGKTVSDAPTSEMHELPGAKQAIKQ